MSLIKEYIEIKNKVALGLKKNIRNQYQIKKFSNLEKRLLLYFVDGFNLMDTLSVFKITHPILLKDTIFTLNQLQSYSRYKCYYSWCFNLNPNDIDLDLFEGLIELYINHYISHHDLFVSSAYLKPLKFESLSVNAKITLLELYMINKDYRYLLDRLNFDRSQLDERIKTLSFVFKNPRELASYLLNIDVSNHVNLQDLVFFN